MTFEVYALREIGSPEMRYVGQTGKGRTARMNFLANLGRLGLGEVEMREWLWSCNFAIEAILLKEVATREEAKAVERLAIELFWFAGHRLVNLQGRPKAAQKAPIALPTRSWARAA